MPWGKVDFMKTLEEATVATELLRINDREAEVIRLLVKKLKNLERTGSNSEQRLAASG